MKRKIKNTIISIVLLICIGSVFSLYKNAIGEDGFLTKVKKSAIGNDPNCYKEIIQVQISETVFKIPGKAFFWGDNLPKNPSGTVSGQVRSSGLCYHKGDEPLEIERLRFSAGDIPKFNNKELGITNAPFNVIHLSASVFNESAEYPWKSVLRILKENNLTLSDLQKNNGFYTLDGEQSKGRFSGWIFYIPLSSETLNTMENNGIFYCSKGKQVDCGVSYMADNIVYGASKWNPKYIEKSKWNDFSYTFKMYIENLIVK